MLSNTEWSVAQHTVVFDDLDEDRICAVFTALSQAVPVGTNRLVTLSLLDMCDRERISLRAERDPEPSVGTKLCRLTKDEIVSLTAVLETIREQCFLPNEGRC